MSHFSQGESHAMLFLETIISKGFDLKSSAGGKPMVVLEVEKGEERGKVGGGGIKTFVQGYRIFRVGKDWVQDFRIVFAHKA